MSLDQSLLEFLQEEPPSDVSKRRAPALAQLRCSLGSVWVYIIILLSFYSLLMTPVPDFERSVSTSPSSLIFVAVHRNDSDEEDDAAVEVMRARLAGRSTTTRDEGPGKEIEKKPTSPRRNSTPSGNKNNVWRLNRVIIHIFIIIWWLSR